MTPPLGFADGTVDVRGSLVTGRVVEDITGRPVEGFTATLSYAHAGGSGAVPTTLGVRPGGWFVLHGHPARDLPDLSAAGAVTLRLQLHRPERPDLPDAELVRVVDGADLALEESSLELGGQVLRAVRVAGAPFRLDGTVPPDPVRLDGLVVRDHDPTAPVGGVTVTAAPAPPVVTGPDGRFVVAGLPVVEQLTLRLEDAGSETLADVRPDYGRRVMSATFSVPTT